jgi:hypothetical protein
MPHTRLEQLPLGVKSAVQPGGHPLPVCPDKQTASLPVQTSHIIWARTRLMIEQLAALLEKGTPNSAFEHEEWMRR